MHQLKLSKTVSDTGHSYCLSLQESIRSISLNQAGEWMQDSILLEITRAETTRLVLEPWQAFSDGWTEGLCQELFGLEIRALSLGFSP